MILHARDIVDPDLSADVVIIGAGAAGITLAQALQGRNAEVLLIDGGGLEVSADAQRLFETTSIGAPVSPDAYRYRVFGGSTVAWTGRCAPLDPIDLAQRDWVPDSGWPIGYDDLVDHYDRAAAIVGLQGAWSTDPDWFRELWSLDGRPDAVEPFLWRLNSTKRNSFLHFGKAFHDRFKAASDLRVLLEADLVGIDPTPDGGAIAGARLRARDGRTLRVRARTWILCCGGIENARLLLNFAEQEPAAFDAVAPSIGRWFMQHPRSRTATVQATWRQADMLQRRFNLFRRTGRHYESGFVLAEKTQRGEELLNASAVLRYEGSPIHRKTWGLHPPRRAPERIARFAAGWQPRLYAPDISLHVDIEQVPDRESRVLLRPERDAIGLQKAALDWRINAIDRRTTAFLTEAVATWIERLGMGRVEAIPDLRQTGGLTGEHMLESYHHLGATRMSASPETGVVNPDLKVHGLANLYVCGGSVLPTGGHANPTLTIVALALRLANHLSSLLVYI